MRKALIVGIDYYEHFDQLKGCVNDAYNVKPVLERHSDGTINFGVKFLAGMSEDQSIQRRDLKDEVENLFRDDSEIALFYFSGHGYIDNSGGYLSTSECKEGDEGLSMEMILKYANDSPARSKVIILDCCHGGIAGNPAFSNNNAVLAEGVTILTASASDQYAMEENDSGVFTSLFVDALNGGAANLVGDITPGSVYAHIDQSLGPWEQRPIFKTNVKSFISLRTVQPPIDRDDLRQLTALFPNCSYDFALDPSFEPTEEAAIEENTEKFAILQKLNHVNLVVPIDEDHMYYAAKNSTGCQLTILGEHYWKLVHKERI